MLIAILGDVHSNREALDVVLADALSGGVRCFLQVGDIVGYGPDPGYCIERLRELDSTICMGNHDAAVLGQLPLEFFNPFARHALEWTRAELDTREKGYLTDLPLLQELPEHGITVVHGSLYQPFNFDYVRSLASARLSLLKQTSDLCFVGHTHQPCLFTMEGEELNYVSAFERDCRHRLVPGQKVLVNVGSVGQPRDENPLTAYVLFDSEKRMLHLIRLEYDIASVQAKIREKRLPEVLAERLAFGL